VRMNVVSARHFRGPTSFLADEAPANRKRQVHDLAGEQAVFRRRFEFGFHGVFPLVQLRRSYQYVSDRTMYSGTLGHGYHEALPMWEVCARSWHCIAIMKVPGERLWGSSKEASHRSGALSSRGISRGSH
jgi:hypothetical protein